MTTVEANGVTIGVEHFGDAAAPLVLLAGGTMLSWPDALCEALARGGRHVVRYVQGSSTSGRRTWRASASAGWSPRSPRSITRVRSRRSRS